MEPFTAQSGSVTTLSRITPQATPSGLTKMLGVNHRCSECIQLSNFLGIVEGDGKFQFMVGLEETALLLTLRRCVRKNVAQSTAKQYGEKAKESLTQRRNVKVEVSW